MLSSASEQYEPNLALQFATRAGKLGALACSGLPAVSRKR